jgi:hypothetical protein
MGGVAIFGVKVGEGLRGGLAGCVFVGATGWYFDRLIKEAPDKNRMPKPPTTMQRTINIFALEKDHFVINPYPSRQCMAIDLGTALNFLRATWGRKHLRCPILTIIIAQYPLKHAFNLGHRLGSQRSGKNERGGRYTWRPPHSFHP